MLGRKGQGIAIDFLFATLVFLLVLNTSMTLIANGNQTVSDKSLLNELQSKSAQTLDIIVRTDGEPNNWEEKSIGSVTTIGLAKRDRALESGKVQKFTEWATTYRSADYNAIKSLLLIGYDYYFEISDSEGIVIANTGKPDVGVRSKGLEVSAKRIVNYEGEEAIARLTFYFQQR